MIRTPSTENLLKSLRSDLRGNDGYSPVKGKDYFTPEEIQQLIVFIISQIKPGEDGYTPIKGIDYQDGEPGKPGKNGKTPIRTVDYWTEEDKTKIIAEVNKLVAKQIPTVDSIVKKLPKVDKTIIKYEDIKDAPDVSDLPKLVDLLRRGGLRGGGDTVAAGTNITITRANGLTTINAAAGGGAMVVEIPSGLVNSSNTSYTSNALPKIIVTDYGTLVNQAIMQVPGVSGFTYTGTGPYNISVPMGPNNFIIVYS